MTLEQSFCEHKHVVVCRDGGMHFNGGDVWDDYREYILCKECGKELTENEEKEVRNRIQRFMQEAQSTLA